MLSSYDGNVRSQSIGMDLLNGPLQLLYCCRKNQPGLVPIACNIFGFCCITVIHSVRYLVMLNCLIMSI